MSALRRTFDATFLNQVVNHPEVRPWLGTDRASPIDMTALVRDAKNVALVNEHGGFVFAQKAPSVYEVHGQFLKAGRGKNANAAFRQALRYMFQTMRANSIVAAIPADNPAAQNLALRNGFISIGAHIDECLLTDKRQIIHELSMSRYGFFKASRRWGNDKMQASESIQCL